MQAWLSKNIATLTLATPVLLVIFILFSLIGSIDSLRLAGLTKVSAELALLSNQAIAEIQKERGLSAGYIGSEGKSFRQQLLSQRKKVDAALSTVLNAQQIANVPIAKEFLVAPIQQYQRNLQNLRQSVDSVNIEVGDAVKQYTQFTTSLLLFNGKLVSSSGNALGKQKFLLLFKLANLQETAGLERALLNNLFASGMPSSQQLIRFQALLDVQHSLLGDLSTLSTPEFLAPLLDFKGSVEQSRVAKFRQQIGNYPANALTASSDEWFSVASARIDALSYLQRSLFEQLNAHADEEDSAAFSIVLLDIILLALTFVIAVASYIVMNVRKRQSNELRKKLSRVIKRFDLTLSIDKISHDDLGDVTELLNTLLQRFKDDLASFQAAAHDIASASVEATASSESTATNVRLQQGSVASSLSSMETINVGIDADLASTKQLNQYAQKSTALARDGESRVSEAVSGIRGTASEVEKVGKTIEVLNLRVEDILKMVDVIRSVADQTNLLALNAAIEAARAGEQGRGFAVVADEVRALAKRTQESTEEISRVVDELNASSNNAFTAIAVGAEKAKDAVGLADQISVVLASVAQNMKELENLSGNVNQSAQQQGASLRHLAGSIREMDASSIENSQSAEQVSAAANQLSSVANEMLSNISKYKVDS